MVGISYQKVFQEGIDKANQKAKTDPKIKSALEKYDGRTFVFNVTNDAVYVFKISRDEVKLEVSSPSYPDDMYLEMNKKRADKLVHHRQVSKVDVIFGNIKFRNISLEDVNFFKEIL